MTQTAQHTLPAVDLWQVIEEFRVGLRAACASDLRGLVLYGSYARGEEHEESDIDRAQKLRLLGDYSTEPFEQSTAEEVLRNARRFVDAVRGYLEEVL